MSFVGEDYKKDIPVKGVLLIQLLTIQWKQKRQVHVTLPFLFIISYIPIHLLYLLVTDGIVHPPQVSNGYHGYNNRPYTNGSYVQQSSSSNGGGGDRYSPSQQGRRVSAPHHYMPPSSPKTHHRYGGGRRDPSPRDGLLLHPFTAG